MAAPLARAQELAMAYGPRNYAAFAQAKTEVEALNAQIPYDHGTHQAVKDLLHACEMLVHDAKEHWDERENRDIVHHISIGLFRFLHEGKPVDRGKIELPDWMREGESKKFMSARDEANLAARRREELEAGSSKEWNWRAANNEGSAKAERDTPLGEALAYATIGRWGCQFFDVVSGGSGDAASEKLRRFQQFAYDGSLRVWGKREIWSDLYQGIPREHWQQNQVEWFDLLRGRPRTEPRGPTGEVSYHDLIVSRAEIEGTMTFEGSQH
jgi:hypothetical protein